MSDMKTCTINIDSLVHHLRVVADHYSETAQGFRTEPEIGGMASQFERQATECRDLADALDARQTVWVDLDTLRVSCLSEVEVDDAEGLSLPDDRHVDHLETSVEHPGSLSNLPHDA